MSWAIYSVEQFPKWDSENQCMSDYKQSLGVQVILEAGKWTKVEDFYRHVRWESWVDAAGDGRETIVTGKEVALRMAGDFGSYGIGCGDIDKMPDAERERIEARCKENNLKMRKRFVDRFEEQFRSKMQGGPGRWLPNTYEAECYKVLGLEPPQTVQKIQQDNRPAQQVVIEQKVDPDYLAQLVAAEIARQTAPAPKR